MSKYEVRYYETSGEGDVLDEWFDAMAVDDRLGVRQLTTKRAEPEHEPVATVEAPKLSREAAILRKMEFRAGDIVKMRYGDRKHGLNAGQQGRAKQIRPVRVGARVILDWIDLADRMQEIGATGEWIVIPACTELIASKLELVERGLAWEDPDYGLEGVAYDTYTHDDEPAEQIEEAAEVPPLKVLRVVLDEHGNVVRELPNA